MNAMTDSRIQPNKIESQPISYCETCGKVFRLYKPRPDAKHCSLECRLQAAAFTKDQIEDIRNYRAENKSYSFISRELGVSRGTISRYCQTEGISVVPYPGHVKANLRTAKRKNENSIIPSLMFCLIFILEHSP